MKKVIRSFVKRVLRSFNLTGKTKINNCHFKVPIVKGSGMGNLRITEYWMIDCLNRLFRFVPEGSVVDVGVNLGQTLLKLKSVDLQRRYVGFEPNPFCVSYTRDLIRANRWENCEIIPSGLGSEFGVAALDAESEADTSASIVANLRTGRTATFKQYIPLLRFDSIVGSVGLGDARLVKIDVEGAELEVLAGMTAFLRDVRPVVLCEVLHAHTVDQIPMLRDRNGQILQMLHQLDFRLFQIRKSPDESSVAGLSEIGEFEEAVWNWKTSPALCDYLFIPSELSHAAIEEFGAFQGQPTGD